MDKEILAALLRLVILLPLVCGLAYLTVRYGLGRTGKFSALGAGKRMRVLEQVSLGHRCGLSLVQVGDRYLLFAHQENSIILVQDSDQPPLEIRDPQQARAGLNRVLEDIRQRGAKHRAR